METTRVLVTGERVAMSGREECDCRTALARGLAEYVRAIQGFDLTGKSVKFANVYDTWPDSADTQALPAASVYADGDGSYDTGQLGVMTQGRVPDGRTYAVVAEYATNITIELGARSKDERAALVAAIERALVPEARIYAARLVLPHYFNAVAEYSLQTNVYENSPDQVQAGRWTATVTVAASVPQVRVFGRVPDAVEVRARVELDETAE
jgi:hypothetical protein